MIEFLFLLIASNVAAWIVDCCTGKAVKVWHMINGAIDVFTIVFIAEFIKGFFEIVWPVLVFYLK